MRTYEQIYNQAKQDGIIDVYDKANTLRAQYLITGGDMNSINYEFSQQQLLVLSALQYEITGIRPGSCMGCIQDVVRRMNTWLINNKPQAQVYDNKRKRKA
jgi:hypothetical protein